MTSLHLAPRPIDCECDSDAYEARIERSVANLRALGAPETMIAHHTGILTGINAENARLHAALGEETTMYWEEAEAQAERIPKPIEPENEAFGDDGLGLCRAFRSAAILIGVLIGLAATLFFAVNAMTHDESGRVRAAVERAK